MTKSRGLREHHGQKHTKSYASWCGMRERCLNQNCKAFPNYGGRGITISAEWGKFSSFYRDMGDPPDGYTLERIDNNKGYSAENCRWATRTEQSRNRRSLVQVTMNNETHPLSVWVEKIGAVSYATAHRRIVMGWTIEDAIKTPLVTRRKGIPRGRRIAGFTADQMIETTSGPMPLWQAVEASGLNYDSVMQRIKRGWPVSKALALSPRKGPRKEAWSEAAA
jgi:hypothetical protein